MDALRALDSCTVSNAVESLDLRLRNEGFVVGTAHCQFPDLPSLVGYAVTGRMRSSAPPMTGRCYYDRMDFWHHVMTVPAPRVLVIQDVDRLVGAGALVGEIHAQIGRALDCVGYVTNGAVRDLPAVHALGFHLFAGSVAVSHAYAHVVDFGEPVEIGGLRIHPGDLLHGDRHGILTVPLAAAERIPAQAAETAERERSLIDHCQAPGFSLKALGETFGLTE
jgi:regulator of RNase E activity RraA